MSSFFSPYRHQFIRVGACVPHVAVAEPAHNAEAVEALLAEGDAARVGLMVFPELCLSAYAIDDLLFQDALLDAVEVQIDRLVQASRDRFPVFVVGAPLRSHGQLYNCAIAIHRGHLLGVVPKVFLPNYREFYERRHFTSGSGVAGRSIAVAGHEVPFGADLLFAAAGACGFHLPRRDLRGFVGAAAAEQRGGIGRRRDPAQFVGQQHHDRQGANAPAVVRLAIGALPRRLRLFRRRRRRVDDRPRLGRPGRDLRAGSRAGRDRAFLGDARDRRSPMSISGAFARSGCAPTPSATARAPRAAGSDTPFRTVGFDFEPPEEKLALRRNVERFPYVPADPAMLADNCYEAYNIQVQGLAQRLKATGLKKLVIGVSGGLDSTQALIVSARAMDRLGLPRTNILAYTLPGFATGEATKANAWRLMKALKVSGAEIDIRPAARQMLQDIGHATAKGEADYDVTFENVQAGLRTDYLFRLANHNGGLVVGTGDLSELGLGWCTYGVGDQMSHYNPNASVAKTLIQHLIRFVAATGDLGPHTAPILYDILATEISPELVPPGADGLIQSTESIVGPYALQDFNLYYATRYGFSPSKIAYLSWNAWHDIERGALAGQHPGRRARRAYDLPEIKHWLRVFLHRFFQLSQFKRSALPNGPKISSGGSLSPRGDWRAPSDATATVWLEELEADIPDKE